MLFTCKQQKTTKSTLVEVSGTRSKKFVMKGIIKLMCLVLRSLTTNDWVRSCWYSLSKVSLCSIYATLSTFESYSLIFSFQAKALLLQKPGWEEFLHSPPLEFSTIIWHWSPHQVQTAKLLNSSHTLILIMHAPINMYVCSKNALSFPSRCISRVTLGAHAQRGYCSYPRRACAARVL